MHTILVRICGSFGWRPGGCGSEAMRKIPGRLLAGLSASVTGLRAKRDGSSCDLLFDDEEHAATWYV